MAKNNKRGDGVRKGKYETKLRANASFGQLVKISVKDKTEKNSSKVVDKPKDENNEDQE